MSKSVLVIDTPKNCEECLLKYDYLHCIIFENKNFGELTDEEFKELREGYSYTSEYCDYRPKLCPLKSLPERRTPKSNESSPQSVTLIDRWRGFDECLNEILGGNYE